MNFWAYLARRKEISADRWRYRRQHPRAPLFHWPDARGWIGIAVFLLTVMVLWMIKEDAELRKDEFFKVIATAIVLTGFISGVVGWAYAATKQGGELAESNARIAEEAATAAVVKGATTDGEPAPQSAAEGAKQAAEAADDKAEEIAGQVERGRE